jgi:hypothetical protein
MKIVTHDDLAADIGPERETRYPLENSGSGHSSPVAPAPLPMQIHACPGRPGRVVGDWIEINALVRRAGHILLRRSHQTHSHHMHRLAVRTPSSAIARCADRAKRRMRTPETRTSFSGLADKLRKRNVKSISDPFRGRVVAACQPRLARPRVLDVLHPEL